jgi:FkbM family methyltransferase
LNGEALLIDRLSRFNLDVVFDVGANVGEWSKFIELKFNNTAELHAFELSPTTVDTLILNCLKSPSIKINKFGLSNETMIIEYKDYGVDSGKNTLLKDADFHDKQIEPNVRFAEVLKGAEYCRNKKIDRIDFLKIDVEGAENYVLEGFKEFLEEGKIKVIQFEYGYTHGDAKFLMKDFYMMLKEYDYILGPLKPTGVLFMDFSYPLNDFNSGPNYVAVHKSQTKIINAIRGKSIPGFPS